MAGASLVGDKRPVENLYAWGAQHPGVRLLAGLHAAKELDMHGPPCGYVGARRKEEEDDEKLVL